MCAANTFNDVVGNYRCDPCPDGTYQPDLGQITCIAKPDCAPGRGFNEALGSCEVCSVGTFSDTTDDSTCEPCARGTYSSDMGRNSCTTCPAGTFQDQLGATSLDTCIDCFPGMYQPDGGEALCLPCRKGEFQPN